MTSLSQLPLNPDGLYRSAFNGSIASGRSILDVGSPNSPVSGINVMLAIHRAFSPEFDDSNGNISIREVLSAEALVMIEHVMPQGSHKFGPQAFARRPPPRNVEVEITEAVRFGDSLTDALADNSALNQGQSEEENNEGDNSGNNESQMQAEAGDPSSTFKVYIGLGDADYMHGPTEGLEIVTAALAGANGLALEGNIQPMFDTGKGSTKSRRAASAQKAQELINNLGRSARIFASRTREKVALTAHGMPESNGPGIVDPAREAAVANMAEGGLSGALVSDDKLETLTTTINNAREGVAKRVARANMTFLFPITMLTNPTLMASFNRATGGFMGSDEVTSDVQAHANRVISGIVSRSVRSGLAASFEAI